MDAVGNLMVDEVHGEEDEEDADVEDDQAAWDFMTGPLSIQALLGRSRKRAPGGSRQGKRENLDRRRQKGHEDLWADYFSDQPTYDEMKFKRRFRMSRRLFNRILQDVCAFDDYFQQKIDAVGKRGLSPHQKITVALRQLAYGIGADATDEYCRIAQGTALEALYRFCRAVRGLYEAQYLRKPSREDFQHALTVNQARGFPGMFGSLDCMHWIWKNCPVAWQGQYSDKDRKKSLILEAIDDQELWIWHAFFGLAGGNNDINVLDRSPLLNEWLRNDSASFDFTMNGTEYSRAYLLVDAIYPEWSMFISTIHQQPQTEKLKHFARCQEVVRKDVERAFGVLQARFEIVKRHARSWYEFNLVNILMCCVVLHNMIIEDEREESTPPYFRVPALNISQEPMPWLEFLEATAEISDRQSHFRLRNDIIDHLWPEKDLVTLMFDLICSCRAEFNEFFRILLIFKLRRIVLLLS